jgi:hypothetical protein
MRPAGLACGNYRGARRRYIPGSRECPVRTHLTGSGPGSKEATVSHHMKVGIIGIIIGLILLFALPAQILWLGAIVIVIALAVPVAGYFMLDPSQRRRMRQIQNRRK